MVQTAWEFADRALEAAGIGGWEYDVLSGGLMWTPQTFRIHDMEPGEAPPIEQAIGFYPTQARPVIEAAVRAAIEHGTPWDLELPMHTASGRLIWARSWGRAVQEDGRTTRVTGAFQDVTARRELAERADRLSVVVRQMTNAVIITDTKGRTEWVNDAFCQLTGFSLAELQGRKPGEMLQGQDTDPLTVDEIRGRVAAGEGFDVEIINYTKAGEPYWISVTCTPLRDATGAVSGFIAVESDITARKRAEAEVEREAMERQRAEALLRDVLEALPSGVSAYDHHERLVLMNQAFMDMFPVLAAHAGPGRTLDQLIRHGAAHGQYPEAQSHPGGPERWVTDYLAEFRVPAEARTLRLPDGRFVQARQRRSATGNLVCIRTDTTDLVRAEAEVRCQAERDPLTGLANRSALLGALQREIVASSAWGVAGGVLLMFDVDHFKQINDSLGHDVGDALLVQVGARLRAATRTRDVSARLGGDEFAALLPGLDDPQIVSSRIGEIQAALSAPIDLGGRRLSVSVSGGVTIYPQDGGSVERLLKNADLALYEAKRAGRARLCMFRAEQAEALDAQQRLLDALRRALEDGAIEVAFQPEHRIDGSHVGFEALARWHDGARWVPPSDFFRVAEGAGLVLPLGRAVVHAALTRFRALCNMGLDPGRVAINVSGPQLADQGFVAETVAALARHGVAPDALALEVTETMLAGRSAERVEQVLRECKALGMTIALDDFGTGFASLANLSRLPLDQLKIDRSFVAEIGQAGRGQVIARSVIGLAHSLGLVCVAEGVETPEQLAFLKAEGCDAVQGYLICRPLLSTGEAADHLRRHGRFASRPVEPARRALAE